jgi:hypothetical protein
MPIHTRRLTSYKVKSVTTCFPVLPL